MSKVSDKILLGHGNGGVLMHQLIEEVFLKHFQNEKLHERTDAAILNLSGSRIAFTTDSFVVDPVIFPGGNIGKLAVCGTVNDLSVSGAIPKFISVSLILEEGLELNLLEQIIVSLANEAKHAGVEIVTGDTKVVNRGKCDKIFINTTGIGIFPEGDERIGSIRDIVPGDVIILSGTMGDHGMAVMNARQSFNFKTPVVSDCASLNHLILEATTQTTGIKFMRDPTRGGVATVLNELAGCIEYGITIHESELLVQNGVRAMCEILGYDPLYMANEGKVLMVVAASQSQRIVDILRNNPLGRNSAAIGIITTDYPGKVLLQTQMGGRRIIDPLMGDPLPRIC